MEEYEELSQSCPHCGGEMQWHDCLKCDGESGYYFHEVSPIEYDPDEFSIYHWYGRAGASWSCANTPPWCAANPLSEINRP